MLTKDKLKKIKKVIRKHFFNLTDEVKKIYFEEITCKKDIQERLSINPSVENLILANRYVYRLPSTNNEEYLKYFDVADFDDSESYTKRKKAINDIITKLGIEDTIIYRYGSYRPDGTPCSAYCFLVHRGRNGSGDFVNIDMPEIADIVFILRSNGASDATPLDAFIDAADDLSDWVIGFHLDEDV